MLALMLISLLLAVGFCLGLIPLVRRIGLVDHPDQRKAHEYPTPLTGGPALLNTFGLMMVCLYQGNPLVKDPALGSFLMFVVGLIAAGRFFLGIACTRASHSVCLMLDNLIARMQYYSLIEVPV